MKTCQVHPDQKRHLNNKNYIHRIHRIIQNYKEKKNTEYTGYTELLQRITYTDTQNTQTYYKELYTQNTQDYIHKIIYNVIYTELLQKITGHSSFPDLDYQALGILDSVLNLA